MESPPRATNHCRHYSYERGETLSDGGPRCAAGCDLSASGSVAVCMPQATAACSKREEYTDAERATWKAYTGKRMAMVGEALAVFGAVECGTERREPCPHCTGTLVLQRMRNGHAWLTCTTSGCVGPIHFNVRRETAWPAVRSESS
jgi:hypothetical protein